MVTRNIIPKINTFSIETNIEISQGINYLGIFFIIENVKMRNRDNQTFCQKFRRNVFMPESSIN